MGKKDARERDRARATQYNTSHGTGYKRESAGCVDPPGLTVVMSSLTLHACAHVIILRGKGQSHYTIGADGACKQACIERRVENS